jgi:phage shock protein B
MNWNAVAVFAFVLLIIVIRSHYRSLERQSIGLAAGDQGALDRAMETARRLEQRVETLERLLDEDAPGWRARARS